MNKDREEADNKLLAMSYLELRRAVGVLGIALPVILVVGAFFLDQEGILNSISAYYYTSMEGVFVGILFVTGAFLFSYKGHEPKDDYAGDLACIFAIGIALFPSTPEKKAICSEAVSESTFAGKLHFVFAALYFITLIYFCLFLFTKSNKPPDELNPEKRFRNAIYRVCGYTMAACIILIGLYFFVLKCKYSWLDNLKPVFWLETLAVWAFGFSWLIKGETLFRDKECKEETAKSS